MINSIVWAINTSKSTYGKLLHILQYQNKIHASFRSAKPLLRRGRESWRGEQRMSLCVREKTSLHKKCLLSRSYTSPLHDWTFLLVVYEFSTLLLHCYVLRHLYTHLYHNIKVIIFTTNPIRSFNHMMWTWLRSV